MQGAKLREVDLRHAHISPSVNWANADLRGADLRGSDLLWPAIYEAIQSGADVTWIQADWNADQLPAEGGDHE
jgi:uncharacterized protein YjbI with pentapeptide repeats